MTADARPHAAGSGPRPIARLSEIAGAYDVFLVDQWGVLHDGVALYPGAQDALADLMAHGKRVVLLTNSSKTVAVNEARLATRFGVGRASYHALVSSAELLRDALAARAARAGVRVFCVADAGDEVLLDGVGCTRVDDPAEADCVVLLSVAPGEGLDEHRGWLERARVAGRPLLSPSADALSVSATRGVVAGLAAIVAAYAAGGGPCVNFGKPEGAVYDAALAGLDVPPERVLMIGDQLESDVAGARRRGFASCLVLTGAGAARVGATEPRTACRVLAGPNVPEALRPTYVAPSMAF
ncbi:TIGR01459 family HAD-type hydrolase [Salinarimonas sp.]|uniref:TIGR01459 family HAD-type hydrolase n=1 Tax=Salinarimonas sp. TaxID=2766526 RepID=UPI0032D93566